jgi:hypothetical protein
VTRQCREVLEACDFPESAARDVERYLSRCTPAQVTSLVWGKDPDGRRTADWFAPFFNNGYVKSKHRIECSFDAEFWQAYDWLSQALPEDFSSFDLTAIDEMSNDLPRMRRAASAARVKTVPYLFKVFQGMERIPPARNNADRLPEVGASNVQRKRKY